MSNTESTYLGLRTVVYFVTDLKKATEWYAEVLGFKPYCDTPYYVGFNVGGFELGLHPAEFEPARESASGIAYWGVPSAKQELDRLVELGATLRKDVEDVGGDIKFGEVVDPFGNVFGIIENPHFPNTA